MASSENTLVSETSLESASPTDQTSRNSSTGSSGKFTPGHDHSRSDSLKRVAPSKSDRSLDRDRTPIKTPTATIATPTFSGKRLSLATTEYTQLLHKHQVQVRAGCERLVPKIASSFGQGIDPEKRNGDHQTSVAQTCHEVSTDLGDTLLGQVLAVYSGAQNNVSINKAIYDMSTEQQVIRPLQSLCISENADSIEKLHKRLQKSSTEVQLLSAKLQKAESSNKEEPVSIRKDLEAARERTSNIRSQYETEVLEDAAGRELSIAEKLVHLTEERVKYYEESLKLLRQSLKKMKNIVDTSTNRPAFGCSLEHHCAATNSKISPVIRGCCAALLPHIQTEAGLFRLAGPATQIRKAKASLNNGFLDFSDISPHTTASLLKQYLRELQNPLMTSEKQSEWIELPRLEGGRGRGERFEKLKKSVDELPPVHYDNLKYLVVFLHQMCEYQDVTKMGASNLALVIGPNLVHVSEAQNFHLTNSMCIILEELIANCNGYFPKGTEIDTTLLPLGINVGNNLFDQLLRKKHLQAQSDRTRSLDEGKQVVRKSQFFDDAEFVPKGGSSQETGSCDAGSDDAALGSASSSLVPELIVQPGGIPTPTSDSRHKIPRLTIRNALRKHKKMIMEGGHPGEMDRH